MNSLIRFAALNITKASNPVCRPFTLSHKYKKNSDDQAPTMSATFDDQIKTIQKNEDNYYTDVKRNFDSVQAKRSNESVDEKRARLIYQSRKRGITENGLLLGNFSAEFVPGMSEQELDEYNLIINSLANEWDLYYWLTNARPLPDDLKDSVVLKKMVEYCRNEGNKERLVLPQLPNLYEAKKEAK